MAQIAYPYQSRQLGYLAARPMSPVTNAALTVVVAFAKWEDRHRTRKALKQLSNEQLRDIGLSREEALDQARRPFWQD